MEFTIRPCANAKEWDDFILSMPWATPQHFFAWGETLELCFGYLKQAYYLFCFRGKAVAALPFMRFTAIPPFRASYSLSFSSYGGPLVCPEYLNNPELLSKISREINCEAARQKAFEARFTLPAGTPDAILRCLRHFDSTVAFTRSCPMLDLNNSLEQIREAYKPSVRRAIARSARLGVVVEENVKVARVREAFPVYQAAMNRIRGTAKPFRFVETLIRRGLAVPFVASLDGDPIGIVILLVSPTWAIYWLSGADKLRSTYRPTNALVDQAISWCYRQGIRVFSFGESHQERAGLVRFKQGWGPAQAESHVVIRIYHPQVHRIWQVCETTVRGMYSLWNRTRESLS